MPSIINTFLLALHAAALVIPFGQSSIYVVASPVPTPPTLARQAADLSPPTGWNATQDASRRAGQGFARRNISSDPHSSSYVVAAQSLHRREDLWRSYDRAKQHTNNLQALSKRYRSGENNDDMQRIAVTEAQGYQSNFHQFQSLLDQLGSDKGLANYDKTSDLETLLKKAVDLNKCFLTAVYEITNDIPVLGPILAPIVYQIKCILDDVLNLCENLTDGILNDLRPALQALIGTATTMSCPSGINVLGLCL